QQTLRVVTLAREALTRRGIEHPAQHLAVLRKHSSWGYNGLVMIKKTPFTAQELGQIRDVSATRAFEPIALPDEHLTNAFTDYIQEPDPERFYQNYSFDVRPPTDDRPFFFNTFRLAMLQDYVSLRQSMDPFRVYNFDAVFILLVLLVLAAVF